MNERTVDCEGSVRPIGWRALTNRARAARVTPALTNRVRAVRLRRRRIRELNENNTKKFIEERKRQAVLQSRQMDGFRKAHDGQLDHLMKESERVRDGGRPPHPEGATGRGPEGATGRGPEGATGQGPEGATGRGPEEATGRGPEGTTGRGP